MNEEERTKERKGFFPEQIQFYFKMENKNLSFAAEKKSISIVKNFFWKQETLQFKACFQILLLLHLFSQKASFSLSLFLFLSFLLSLSLSVAFFAFSISLSFFSLSLFFCFSALLFYSLSLFMPKVLISSSYSLLCLHLILLGVPFSCEL